MITEQPYSAEEKFLMMAAKVRADVSEEQSRMDEVWSHPRGGGLLIGNKFAAEDAHYLHLHGVTHLLNMANNLVKMSRPEREGREGCQGISHPPEYFRMAGTLLIPARSSLISIRLH